MITATFEYDETRVCASCGTNDQVHYNLYVNHGSDCFNNDPDTPVWCESCGETSMFEPEDGEK
jgi:hypothetical protein